MKLFFLSFLPRVLLRKLKCSGVDMATQPAPAGSHQPPSAPILTGKS